MSKPKIAIIIGSTRQARMADKVAGWVMEHVRDHPDFNFELIDLRQQDLPFFDEAASNLWMPSADPRARAWQHRIGRFDGYIFLVAEYNHSIPAALKNALDQAYVEWNRKPMAAIGYGGVGAARAIEHLRAIAVELQMVPLRNAVHLGGGEFFQVSPLGSDGDMAAVDAVLKPALDSMLQELLWWTDATRMARAADAERAAA